MFLQNEKGLIDPVARVGCYFLTLAKMTEIESRRDLTVQDVNEIWTYCTKNGWIGKDERILSPDKVLREFMFRTSSPARMAQVGEIKDGNVVFWDWAKDKFNDPDYYVEMLLTKGKEGTHFVLCNSKKEMIYDSYSFKQYNSTKSGRYLLYQRINV